VQLTGDKREELTMIPSVVARTWLAIALTELGEFAEGMIHAKRALAVAEQAEHQLSQVLGWLAIGHLLLRKGEVEGAVGALERGLELCDRWSLRIWRPRVASSLGVAYGRAGRAEEGLALARQAVADVERMRLGVDKAMVLVRLGQAALLCGQVQEAEARGRQAAEIAEAHEERGYEAWARFLIGRASWAAGAQNGAQAAAQIERALQLARACEARPLVAYCQSALGAIRQRGGDETKGRELAAAADAEYTQLGMRPLPLELRR
jgi:tetratricopeptide (TPR) repeat protein